jgi:hypothetical protein
MATFADVWRKVRLYVPDAPVFLVRTWVQDAYASLCDRRGWVWSVEQGQLVSQVSRDNLAVTVTQGSTTVTSAGLFTSADVGRQFRVGSYPVYTIYSLTDANTITLDQAYYGSANGAVTTAQILDAYATLPANFGRFVIVVSPDNQRIVPWWATQEELDLVDPTRQSTDSYPRLLVARQGSTTPATLGQMQYEYWPYPTALQALQYYMITRPTDLTDTHVFRGVLAHRTDVLEAGALAAAAKWPGTRERPNPYFNLQLARMHQQEFEAAANQLDLRDDDQNQQSLGQIPWQKINTWAWAYNTQLLQATDATLADYAGFGYGGW